jgi:hypothetical protein
MTGTYLGSTESFSWLMHNGLPWQIFRAIYNGFIYFVDHNCTGSSTVDVTTVLPTTTGSIAILVKCSCEFRDQPVVHEMMKDMISPIYRASAVALCRNCRLPKKVHLISCDLSALAIDRFGCIEA